MTGHYVSAPFHEDVFFAYYRPCRPSAVPSVEFIDEYWIQPSHAAYLALQSLDPDRVWTIVSDGHHRDLYFTAGFHLVNREGYVVTERAHAFEHFEFRASGRRRALTGPELEREVRRLESLLNR